MGLFVFGRLALGRFVFGRFVGVPEQHIIIVLFINLYFHETIPLNSNILKLESSPTLPYYCSVPKLCFSAARGCVGAGAVCYWYLKSYPTNPRQTFFLIVS